MKTYITAEVELILLSIADVIATSGPTPGAYGDDMDEVSYDDLYKNK